MNHLFFYEMYLTADNRLEQEFNWEMKVAGLYKVVYFMPRWFNPRGVWQHIRNKPANPPSTALTKKPHGSNSQRLLIKKGREGGRWITSSWKSLIITVNFHSQICKTELSANQKYCMLQQTNITIKTKLWRFGFTEQFSDWIHTLVTKTQKICYISLLVRWK